MKGAMTAVDDFGAKVKAAFSEVRSIGANALGSGLILAETLKRPIAAFAEFEDAQTRLKSVMMGADGTAGAFEQISALANSLGVMP
jgi:hydroxymethylglutaryl-CoA reductase